MSIEDGVSSHITECHIVRDFAISKFIVANLRSTFSAPVGVLVGVQAFFHLTNQSF